MRTVERFPDGKVIVTYNPPLQIQNEEEAKDFVTRNFIFWVTGKDPKEA